MTPELTELHDKITQKGFLLGVIGLGYVGLPLSLTFLRKDIMVLGFGKFNQYDELAAEMEAAKAELEAYKAANPEKFDDSNIVAYTDAENIAKGKELFTSKTCFVCHLNDLGGSIGPNLVDDKWILGGGAQNIYNTITKGGRPNKGMQAWENSITREERIQLTSYIISMQGTSPAAPKAAEGDITWPEE